ncbi:MAG: site-specific integrase [Planctomycetales bacterium]|nr:site-specific integrase [Planctomycetales bacterium]
MARQPKPWYRKDRKVWCVTINGQRHTLGRNKKQAMEQFRALQRQPRRVRVATTMLVAIVDEFLDWVSRNRSEATFEWYRCRLQDFVDTYPDMYVEELKPHHVEKWAGIPTHSVTTRRNQMRSVKRCLKWAVAQGHLQDNPLAHMEVPSGQSREQYVPPDEFHRFLDYVTDENFANLLTVTYETGCRPQESLRVEARHVDLDHARWIFPPREAKVKSMPRVVYMSEHAAEVSGQLMKKWSTGPLFRNARGKPWNKDSVGCAFDRLQIKMGKAELKRTGEVLNENAVAEFAKTLNKVRVVRGVKVPKTPADLLCEAKRKLTQRRARQLAPRYSLYALRHSWATNALQRGVDALTVAILMGHKDPSTLARTYQHLSHNPEHLLNQARKASS